MFHQMGSHWEEFPLRKKPWSVDTDFEVLENGIFVNHHGKLKTDRTLIKLENHRDIGVLRTVIVLRNSVGLRTVFICFLIP